MELAMSDAYALPELFTAEEVARRLKCNPETVRRAIRTGRLAFYKLNGCNRVSLPDLAAYLESNRCPVQGQTDPSSSSGEASTTSSGGAMELVTAHRRAVATRSSLDKALRTSKPVLKVVQPD